jgi:hypothetical protein
MRKRDEHLGGAIFDLLMRGVMMGLGLILAFSLAFESVWVSR